MRVHNVNEAKALIKEAILNGNLHELNGNDVDNHAGQWIGTITVINDYHAILIDPFSNVLAKVEA